MTVNDFADAVRRLVDHLEQTQSDAIATAADHIVHALTHRGAVFVDTIGHGNEGDFLNRAGGLAAVKRFSWNLTASASFAAVVDDSRGPADPELSADTVRLALRAARVRPGDVMIVSSVSGKSARPIELAMACRDMGVRVIGLTSLTYTARVEPAHHSGNKLCDVVDVVIDNGAPFGDAAVRVPGYEIDVLPVSGVSMTVAGWMLWGTVMEKMAAAGHPATVFMSINRPGGKAFHERALEQFNKRGF